MIEKVVTQKPEENLLYDFGDEIMRVWDQEVNSGTQRKRCT